MKVDSLKAVEAIKQLFNQAVSDDRVSVVVGYNAKYALFVHEMTPVHKGEPRSYKGHQSKRYKRGPKKGQKRPGIGVYWGPSLYGNKFLEGPAREFSGDIARIIMTAYQKAKGGLLLALEGGGDFLRRKANQRVPVEFGHLRQSSFVEKE